MLSRVSDASRPEGLAPEFGMVKGKGYFLSDAQAQAILELRLQRLTGLEQDKIVGEYREVMDKVADLLDILAKPARVTQIIGDELVTIRSQFGDKRRSEIVVNAAGFSLEDLPFQEDGSLPLHVDPKTAWAQKYLALQPLEVNRAERAELLRIPGIGPRSAEAILHARRQGRLRSLEDLQSLGVRAQQAAAYILLDGRRPAQQLSLF
jgi:DNA uptake protein ComE-like DNA-binding protein